MPQNNRHIIKDDHDLLIDLSARFSSFSETINSAWNNTNQRLTNIMLKIETIEKDISTHHKEVQDQLNNKADNELVKGLTERVNKLEKYKSWIAGAITVIGTIAGILGTLLTGMVKKFLN